MENVFFTILAEKLFEKLRTKFRQNHPNFVFYHISVIFSEHSVYVAEMLDGDPTGSYFLKLNRVFDAVM